MQASRRPAPDVWPAPDVSPAPDPAVDAFLVASRALVGVAAASLADLEDLTLPQFRALVVLSARGPCPVGTLASALSIHPSTATRLCDRLVRKRLVRRTRGRVDRRSTEVALTAAGHDLVDEVVARRRRAIGQVLGAMRPADRDAAIAALRAFGVAAGEAEPDAVAGDPFGWALAADADPPAPAGRPTRSGAR